MMANAAMIVTMPGGPPPTLASETMIPEAFEDALLLIG
jgi:hypothetical protein